MTLAQSPEWRGTMRNMSLASVPRLRSTVHHRGDRVVVNDPRALSTLAHPLRLRLLRHLLNRGPSTAKQCADALGTTGANCSYHLRHLARYGLAERVEWPGEGDRRERPWRAAATGFEFVGDPADPVTATARSALASLELDESVLLLRRYLDQEVDLVKRWRDAAALNTYGLSLTAE